MRIVVTGAAGFIGSHLVERLIAAEHDVVGVDNFDCFYDPALKRRNVADVLQSPRLRLIEGDIRDPEVLAALPSCDAVVHLAARAGVRSSIEDPVPYIRINVEGTVALLDAYRRLGTGHFVLASSSSVYGITPHVPFCEDDLHLAPISPYGASKLAAEQFCRTVAHLTKRPITCLRFFTVYGPRQRPDMAIARFVDAVERRQPITMYGDGGARRDFTYVDDIIDGIVRAVERPAGFRVYNLGTERTVNVSELLGIIERALGVAAVIVRQPVQPGDVPLTHASIARAARELGYSPRTSLEEGVARYVAWRRARRA